MYYEVALPAAVGQHQFYVITVMSGLMCFRDACTLILCLFRFENCDGGLHIGQETIPQAKCSVDQAFQNQMATMAARSHR